MQWGDRTRWYVCSRDDEVADSAYDTVSTAAGNEVAGRLAQRLAQETQGEVLFSPADRGRYATDASIYQVLPVGVFMPRSSDEVKIALDICRDLKVPVVPRGGGTSQCGQTVGAGLVIDHSKYVRRILNFGHTLGHALEKCMNFQIHHGQAVAIGMLFDGRAEQLTKIFVIAQ